MSLRVRCVTCGQFEVVVPTSNKNNVMQIAPELHVGGQLHASDLPGLFQRGIRTIVSLRPDEEDGVALPSDAAAQLADAHGMAFKHLPVAMADATDDRTIDQFEQALEQVQGPVFVYCKTGTRAAIAWALATARREPLNCILAATHRAGFDLSMLLDEMQDQADRHSGRDVTAARLECLPVSNDDLVSVPAAA